MQYLVKAGQGFSLVQESTKLDSELTMRCIEGIKLTVVTAFICNPAQLRPVLLCSLFGLKNTSRQRSR